MRKATTKRAVAGELGGSGSIVSDRNPCPHAAESECRSDWRHIAGTETALCGFCYQILSRATLARILASAP